MFEKRYTSPLVVSGDIPDWVYPAVESIMLSLKVVDSSTFYHCIRVGEYSRQLAKSIGLTDYQQKIAQFSGLLHDVGKMGVHHDIIHKPGKLDHHEFQQMKEHPVLSEDIVKPLAQHEFIQQVLPGVRSHHERVDGCGYPDGLSGEEIPLIARLILVVDTLDAMGEDRAYRKGLPVDVIYKELKKFSGSQFDPQLVKVFLEAHKHWKAEKPDLDTLRKVLPTTQKLPKAA